MQSFLIIHCFICNICNVQELAQWRAAFHARFFVAELGSYTNRQPEVQTLNSVALGAGAVPAAHRAAALAATTWDATHTGRLVYNHYFN